MQLRHALAALLLAWASSGPATAGPPSTADFLRRAQYEKVEVSPDGASLAIAYRKEDGTVITVLDRATLQAVAQIDPGDRGEVAALAWLGPKQLVIAANRSVGPFHSPVVQPAIYLLDITRKHPKILPASFLGTVAGDDHHVLALGCTEFSEDGDCRYSVQRLDIDHLSRDGEKLATAPLGDARFLIDHAGRVRFAWGWSNTGRSRLFVRDDANRWTVVNDSDASHVSVVPVGMARDDTSAYLIAERTDGPDAIERYDLATGRRSEVLRDGVSDPLGVIFSLDGKEPIGAWFGPGRPEPRYWDAASEDAKWRRALDKAFPGGMASVVSRSDDGSIMVVLTRSDRDDGSFYLFDRAAHKVSLLFHARPWLDPSQMAPAQAFAFTARDGLALHGFVTRPRGAATPGPTVVMVHGGPYYVSDDWAFDEETQLLAANGYNVVRVNFRGSAGFGRRFMERGYRQWGAAMQDDVTDATRWAVAQGIADPGRICIYGGSYGGYAALMGAAREPRLYRCAIGLAGVYDLSKMYRWGDIHRSDYGMHYLDTVLGRDKDALLARSPSTLAGAIAIPVLLAHGTMDGRVPVQHAKAMQSALKKAGHPAQFVSYDWEGHGLSDPEHEQDFYGRLLAFLRSSLSAPTPAP